MQLGLAVYLPGAEFFHHAEFVSGAWDFRRPFEARGLQNTANRHSTNHCATVGEQHFHISMPSIKTHDVAGSEQALHNTYLTQCLF